MAKSYFELELNPDFWFYQIISTLWRGYISKLSISGRNPTLQYYFCPPISNIDSLDLPLLTWGRMNEKQHFNLCWPVNANRICVPRTNRKPALDWAGKSIKNLPICGGDDDGWENPWKIKIAKGHPARFSLEEKTHWLPCAGMSVLMMMQKKLRKCRRIQLVRTSSGFGRMGDEMLLLMDGWC